MYTPSPIKAHTCLHSYEPLLIWSNALCISSVSSKKGRIDVSHFVSLFSFLTHLCPFRGEIQIFVLSHFLVLPHPYSLSLCFLFLFFFSLVSHMLQTRISWLNIKHQLCGGYCNDKWSRGAGNDAGCSHYRKERKLT